MPVIAMTREMGTLGKDVALGLADRLGVEIIHHELVEQDIAQRAGMRESEVHRFLEGGGSIIEQWRTDTRRLSHYTALEILELAAKGNVLIRGWGAAYLLQGIPHVVSVRICAPMLFRENVMMQRLGIEDRAIARREIERSDGAHNGTMQRMFGADWRDAEHYAIVLNTARVPPRDCVDQIVSLASSEVFRQTPASVGHLTDRAAEIRTRAVLREHFDAGLRAMGIDIKVQEGVAILSGAASDERVIADLVRRVGAVDGVRRVESRIQYLSFARTTP